MTAVPISPSVTQQDHFLTISHRRFPYTWLRYHCLCPECYHPSSGQTIVDSSRYPAPRPASVQWIDDQLIIDWAETPPHRSTFPVPWLLDQSLDPPPAPPTPRALSLWNRHQLARTNPEWPQYGSPFCEWMEPLHTLGFVIIRGIPWEQLDPLVADIGPIHYLAGYPRYSTVKAVPQARDLSLSSDGHGLSPHTDITFIAGPRLVQFLYCVENQARGGESVVVDGFKIAEDFRGRHPEYFRILSTTPVTFSQRFQDWRYCFSHTTPILACSETGLVRDVYFSHKNLTVTLPFEQVDDFYAAYNTFFEYVKDPVYQYQFRLEAGDCLMVQNFRILHGRLAFQPQSGPRHLEVAYMDWSYFTARERFLSS